MNISETVDRGNGYAARLKQEERILRRQLTNVLYIHTSISINKCMHIMCGFHHTSSI
jgi:hypothetical protein